MPTVQRHTVAQGPKGAETGARILSAALTEKEKSMEIRRKEEREKKMIGDIFQEYKRNLFVVMVVKV